MDTVGEKALQTICGNLLKNGRGIGRRETDKLLASDYWRVIKKQNHVKAPAALVAEEINYD